MELEIRQEFQDLHKSITGLQAFIVQNMVTKLEFEERLNELPTKEDYNNLVTKVDAIATSQNKFNEERIVFVDRLETLETDFKNIKQSLKPA